MSEYPPRPSGTDEESVFHQSNWDKNHGNGSKFNSTSTVQVSKTTKGWFWHARRQNAGGPGTSIKTLTFVKSLGDYFLAAEAGGKIYAVAKLAKLRNSILSEVIYGTTVTYSYPHNPVGGGPSADPLAYLYRTATIAGTGANVGKENQGVNPQYLVGDIIYAIEMPSGTGVMSDPKDHVTTPQVYNHATPPVLIDAPPTPITWLQTSTAQAWSKFSNQGF